MQRSPVPGTFSTNSTAYSNTRSTTIISTTNQGQPRVSGYSVNQNLASPLISPAPIPGPSNAPNNLQTSPLQQIEQVPKEEIRSHFTTTEGIYKKMTVATYSRPNKTSIVNAGTNAVPNCPVRVSFVSIPSPAQCNCSDENNQRPFCSEKICFNVGRELFVFDYVSIHGSPNLNLPIDKRIYKGTFPTCHDFNQQMATSESCQLIIGFSAGQVQLIDPLQKEFVPSKLFNEERNIEKTSVTCVKWVPSQQGCFMVSHASGNIYTYNEHFQCFDDPPAYQLFKQGDGFTIFSVKTKNQRNPLSKIQIGSGSAVNEFEFFQGDNLLLAVVSQDGFLRIFDYQKMELMGLMKSYFGGLLCLSWSPDGKLIATGGEDDLLTIYSVTEKRVICRGQGHKSWISKISFDPYSTGLSTAVSSSSIEGFEDNINGTNIVYTTASVNKYGYEEPLNGTTEPHKFPPTINIVPSPNSNGGTFSTEFDDVILKKNASISNNSMNFVGMDQSQSSTFSAYRIGTVGHDTQLLLWDLSEDVLSNPLIRKSSVLITAPVGLSPGVLEQQGMSASTSSDGGDSARGGQSTEFNNSGSTKNKLKKLHKRGFSFGNRLTRAVGATSSQQQNGHINGNSPNGKETSGIFGSPICPKMNEVPLIEPILNKKIAHERLTVLFFREECIVTGCQEGLICTWARPGRGRKNSIGSVKTNTSMAAGVDGLSPGGTHV
ncbi:hypothetical protein FO519_007169 [Halicephalobus sp. NKZ332]|nr:hypothetical protein FO519_007169 [Halicephalobus sp. NKZ332]